MQLRELTSTAPGAVLTADVCLVGAGPAGLTLARELSGSGLTVTLLESGPIEGTAEDDDWVIDSVGSPRVLEQTLVRNRGLGGTSRTWAGRLATFDEMDFAHREWVQDSGWPIEREEVARYFPRAIAHLGGTVPDNQDAGLRRRTAVRPGLDPALLVPYVWTYAHDDGDSDWMRFGPRAVREAMPGVIGFTGATVTEIGLDAGGARVGRLRLLGADGAERQMAARRVVLCAGGLENARLLLASTSTASQGVGNEHDLVGRYLMDHPRGPVAAFSREDRPAALRAFSSFLLRTDGQTRTATPGFALSPALQREERLLNCAVFLTARASADDPMEILRTRRVSAALPALLRSRRPIVRMGLLNARRILLQRRAPLKVLESLEVTCIVEQQPDRRSRVTLSDRRDRHGLPVARVDWRVGELEQRTMRRTVRLLVDELVRVGLPAPQVSAAFLDPSEPLPLPDVAHPTGTTRMAADAARGVVDVDCGVFGVAGLFVAGSSVFPTSGHANPTQTIVALAIRLADHLRDDLARDRDRTLPTR